MLAQTAEVLRILPPEGVADTTHAIGKDPFSSTSAVECSLVLLAHFSLDFELSLTCRNVSCPLLLRLVAEVHPAYIKPITFVYSSYG